MTEDCPGYDRDLRMCLLRPGDCEFNPADAETVLVVEKPEALTPQRRVLRSGDGTNRATRGPLGGSSGPVRVRSLNLR